jgi:hypothetical protein
VDGSGDGYLKTVCDYVHLNPARAGLLKAEDLLQGYPWSSLTWYAAAREHRPVWLRVDRLLGGHGLREDTPGSRQEFGQRMEARRHAEEDEEAAAQIRRGWCFGSPQYRQELLDRFGEVCGENQTSEIRLEGGRARAERIITQDLAALGWNETELKSRRKNDPAKLALATRLRRESTLTTKEIAARLWLGTPKSATTTLHRWMRSNPQAVNQVSTSLP